MILMHSFKRDFQIRRYSDLNLERHFSQNTLTLPKGSTFHYLPENEQDWGIDASDYALHDVEGSVYVEHVGEYRGKPQGSFRTLAFQEDREVKEYHRRHRTLRRSKRRESSIRDPKSLLVVNYASLQHHYQYRRTFHRTYQQWYNELQTVVENIMEHLRTTDRHQFIRLTVPDKLPTWTALGKVNKSGLNSETLPFFPYRESFNVLDAWRVLDPESTESLFDRIPKEYWYRVNLLYQYSGRWFSISLETLKGFTHETETDEKERNLKEVRKRFLGLLMVLQEEGRGEVLNPGDYLEGKKGGQKEEAIELEEDDEEAPTPEEKSEELEKDLDALEEVEDQEDSVAVTAKEVRTLKAKSPDHAFKELAAKMAENGRLSGAEYRRAEKLSESYKKIKSFDGEQTLDEFRQITPEDYAVTSEELMAEDTSVPDASMRHSIINKMRKQYDDHVLEKDVVNHMLSLQKVGGAITAVQKEKIENAAGGFNAYTFWVTPIEGSPAPIRFKLPIFNEDGSFTVNGVNNYMRWQRADLPIRKTGPSTVALTSYYGKAFVQRSDKVAYDYGKWLRKTLVAICLDGEDKRIKNYRLGNAFDHHLKQNRFFAELAQRFLKLDFKNNQLIFERNELLKGNEDAIKKIENAQWTVVGRQGDKYLTMRTKDSVGMLYVYDGRDHQEQGTIEELLELDLTKAPVDTAELRLFNKAIPLGIALGYLRGFKSLYKALGTEPRIVPSGERLNLQPHEYVIRFSNESFVFSREDTEAALMLNGFNQYKRLIQRYSSREFEKPDVYKNLFDEVGLGIRYIREIELMDELFVDPITLGILQSRNEPEEFQGMLFYANELLMTNWHPVENDANWQRWRGHERVTGAVYQELVRAARGYRMNPNRKKAKFEVNPEAVWMNILKDPSIGLVEQIHPIASLKETEEVTFTGVGGRSIMSLVERSRVYDRSDIGITSEGTVDSAKVGATTSLSQDPNFVDIRGLTKPFDPEKDGMAKVFSTTFLLNPCSDKDDAKRTVFAGIQYGSSMGAKGYTPSIIRTGEEKVIPHRTNDLFAQTAKSNGKVVQLDDKLLAIEFDNGDRKVIELGRRFGKGAGLVIPHEVVSPLKPGQKVSKGDVLSYNTQYFEFDPLSPKEILLKTTMQVDTVLWESSDTHEDSSAISEETAERLKVPSSVIRQIVVDFDSTVRAMVKPGTEVDYDDPLCILDKSGMSEDEELDAATLSTLKKITSGVPKAKFYGVVEKVEVLYNGELEDMSPSLAKLARVSNKEIRRVAKARQSDVKDGSVDNSMRVEGNELTLNQAVINVYMTGDLPAGVADKGVFAHQLKTTFRQVYREPIVTESGRKVGAIFGGKSVDDRVVNSAYLIGMAVEAAKASTDEAVAMYFGKVG